MRFITGGGRSGGDADNESQSKDDELELNSVYSFEPTSSVDRLIIKANMGSLGVDGVVVRRRAIVTVLDKLVS
jgi:hypothetical protein